MLFIQPECTEGWYGVNCSQPCLGHCRDGAICNPVTGKCDNGCDVGWTGSMCKNGKDICISLEFRLVVCFVYIVLFIFALLFFFFTERLLSFFSVLLGLQILYSCSDFQSKLNNFISIKNISLFIKMLVN